MGTLLRFEFGDDDEEDDEEDAAAAANNVGTNG